VYAELSSQSMVIMGYLVATAQYDIHATIKSTRFCVVHLTPPVHMQLESYIRSVVAMTRDQMEQLRFRGNVWSGPRSQMFIFTVSVLKSVFNQFFSSVDLDS